MDAKDSDSDSGVAKILIVDDEEDVRKVLGFALQDSDAYRIYEACDGIAAQGILQRQSIDVVVTGRGAPTELIDIADTVTEMKPIKHAFDSGKVAKKGVDY